MILLIDNYDSFAYNLYQLLGELNPEITVARNDRISIADIVVMRPSRIVLSPGPGRPADAGVCGGVIATFGPLIPILGVCLGHEAICETFGATVTYAKRLMHGKAAEISVDAGCPLFAGLPPVIVGGRYHSLAVSEETLPACLSVTARSPDGEVMGVCHNGYPVYGIQFHPESILTPSGRTILRNFLIR